MEMAVSVVAIPLCRFSRGTRAIL